MIQAEDLRRILKKVDKAHDSCRTAGARVGNAVHRASKAAVGFVILVVFGAAVSVYGLLRGIVKGA